MTPSDPSHPTTMKSAMLEAKRLTKKAGQATTLFTAGLQLYRVGLNVQWAYPEIFGEDFTLCLEGMQISEGRICSTPQTRTVERDMDRYGHRDNVFVLWAWARWSHWNNTE